MLEQNEIIYIVTAGEYSDYGIIAATKDKETAERIANKYNKESKYEEAQIEEYYDAIYRRPMTEFIIHLKNGEITALWAASILETEKERVVYADKSVEYKDGYPNGMLWRVDVVADSEDHAQKIAKDYVMKKESEEQGL